MVRCRCGVWTDYGMTCVSCRSDSLLPKYSRDEDADEPKEEKEIEETEEEED